MKHGPRCIRIETVTLGTRNQRTEFGDSSGLIEALNDVKALANSRVREDIVAYTDDIRSEEHTSELQSR